MTDQDPHAGELSALIGPFWSGSKVCASLGLTGDALTSQQQSGDVLGLSTTDGSTMYPVFQFRRRHDGVEVDPALVPIFRALQGHDPWAVAVLIHTPSPELNDMTPLQWARRGSDLAALSELASIVDREWRSGSMQTSARRQ